MNTPNNKVLIDNQANLALDIEAFETMMQIVQHYEKLPKDSFVNLRLSNNDEIRKLNAKYLGRDMLTDVISFRSELPEIPFLGDIIIDTNVAKSQRESRSLSEELVILFLHGLLHLLDYDHLDTTQRKVMQGKESEYLTLFKEINN